MLQVAIVAIVAAVAVAAAAHVNSNMASLSSVHVCPWEDEDGGYHKYHFYIKGATYRLFQDLVHKF